MSLNPLVIYTDGSCLDNAAGGAGGWAGIVVVNDDSINCGEGYFSTTSNRMEIMAVAKMLLESTLPRTVHIYLDSQYTMDGSTKWIKGWIRRNWLTANEQPVKNKDLWLMIHDVLKFHQVSFFKVKGHSGNRFNEVADKVAKSYARNPKLTDEGYIK